MPTSGSITYNVTADTIIRKALSKVAERAAEIPLTSSELSDGLEDLNIFVKALQGDGLHLWKREEGVLFLDVGVNQYSLGPDGAEACREDDFYNTELTADAVATDVILQVADTSEMTDGDFVGIELDDNTRQWTTIVTIDSPTQITITDQLTGDASSDRSVFSYTTQIERPLRIEAARRTRLFSNTEVELHKWSRQEYMAQTNKGSRGTPTNFYYSPQLDNGEFYIWQTASSVQQLLKFTMQTTIEDFLTSSNNPDFPIEWANALIWGLAAQLGDEYQVPDQKMVRIETKAEYWMDKALGFDEEVTTMNVHPTFEGS